MTAPKRLFVDVTESLATGRWTGIERVVRKLFDEMSPVAPTHGFHLVAVAAVDGRFHALTPSGVDRLRTYRAAPGPAQHARSARMIGRLLNVFPALYTRFQAAYRSRSLRPALLPWVEPSPIRPEPGDVVFLLDSYWGGTSSVSAAAKARRDGARVVSALYDMIPVTHPEYMSAMMRIVFPRYLLRALRLSDAVLAISQTSAAALRVWLGPRLPDLPIMSFRLGNDPADRQCSVATQAGLQRYTMIGTIEPRKGHEIVLDAFERRWSRGDTCLLTVVGKYGWDTQDMRLRLEHHRELGARLTVLNDASDAALATVLASTDAVIMASKVEGFGLPIVEALALDIPVIASDIPVFREIARDAAVFFDPDSVDALVAALETCEQTAPQARARAADFRWPSWHESAEDVFGRLDVLLNPERQISVS